MPRTQDVIVIGAGAAGLTAAGGCARLGLRVALIERDRMGGECLNTGCIPSKALLAAARRAQTIRTGGMGVTASHVEIDFAGVLAHVHGAIRTIAPHDSEARLSASGVEVIRGDARFTGPRTIAVHDRELRAPRIVLAVGSRPALPPIDGLAQTPFLTNETLFALETLPRHLVILGAGAIGVEIAQAFRRLGSDVTLIEPHQPLARFDRDAAALVLESLATEGVILRTGAPVTRISSSPAGVRLEFTNQEDVLGSHLLLATGRRAAVDGLRLDLAGVETGADGIPVDARGRTSNRRIFAIGDCRAGPRFTHAAAYDGTVAVMNIGYGLPGRVRHSAMPSVIHTDPELAQIGVTQAEASAAGRVFQQSHQPLADNDRAVVEGDTAGFIKIVREGRTVIGVTIVGAGAGDLLLPWSLAMTRTASLWGLASAIVPYPTRSELSKAAAFSVYETSLFGPAAKLWARTLARLRT